MEESIAILMADLSGYTALTEVHGASSAADLIEKYVEIVQGCLVGDCKMKERTGDEIMIVAASADALLRTALNIMKNTSAEENFLQVHGGLHYGRVLSRKSSYFGSAINVTARIAAAANPGTFWCSGDFIDALMDKETFRFQPKGRYKFKNLSEEKEIAEIADAYTLPYLIDPVCRMLIRDRSAAIPHPENGHLFFCSQTCRDLFSGQPAGLHPTGGLN